VIECGDADLTSNKLNYYIYKIKKLVYNKIYNKYIIYNKIYNNNKIKLSFLCAFKNTTKFIYL